MYKVGFKGRLYSVLLAQAHGLLNNEISQDPDVLYNEVTNAYSDGEISRDECAHLRTLIADII